MKRRKLQFKMNNNIFRIMFVFAFAFIFIIGLNIDACAATGPSSFKRIRNEYLAQDLTVKTGESKNILLTFNMTENDTNTYTLTFYTPIDTNSLYNEAIGQCGAIKHQIEFKKNEFKYQNYVWKESAYVNDTSNYGSVKSIIHDGAELLINKDDSIIAAVDFIIESGEGEFFPVDSNMDFGVTYQQSDDNIAVYFYVTIPDSANNIIYDFKLTDTSGSDSEVYVATNLIYNSKSYYDSTNDDEYIKMTVNKPYMADGSGIFSSKKIPSSIVDKITYTLHDENDNKSNSKFYLSNDEETNEDFISSSKTSFFSTDTQKYICYISTSDMTVQGSSIYYLHMNGDDFNISFEEQILKCYTDPDFDFSRRNYKESYVSVEPYNENGTYKVYLSKNLKRNDTWEMVEGYELYATQYVPLTSALEKIMVPIYIDSTYDFQYVVKVAFEPLDEYDSDGNQLSIISNEKAYVPSSEEQVSIGVPLRVEANNVVVVKSGNEIEVAQYDISFDMPEGLFDLCKKYGGSNDNNTWNEDVHVWFEVKMNTKSKDESSAYYQIADIIYLKYHWVDVLNSYFEVYTQNTLGKDGKPIDKYVRKIYKSDTRITATVILKPYNDDEFSVSENNYGFYGYYESDIILDGTEIAQVTENQSNLNSYTQHTDVITPVEQYDINSFFWEQNKIEDYGSNYYISVKSFFCPDFTKYQINPSEMSVPINVVFQPNKDVIPITDNLNFINQVNNVDITKSNEIAGIISGVDKSDYVDKMLSPIGAELNEVKYEVFISEDLDTLKGVMTSVTNGTSNDNYIRLTTDDYHYDFPVIFETDNDYTSGFNINWLRNKCNPNLNNIRKGVYSFLSGNVFDKDNDNDITKDGELYIKGLDSNTTYYFTIQTVFYVKDDDGNVVDSYSDFSKIFNRSTSTNAVAPSTKDLVPPAPEDFREATDVETDDTKAAVRWKQSEKCDSTTYNYAYEFVRVADERLSDDNKKTSVTMSELASQNLSQFKGVRADQDTYLDASPSMISTYPSSLYVFDKNENKYRALTSTDLIELKTFPTNVFRIIDQDLKPNRIYFFYVRTVQKYYEDGVQKEVYSSWNEMTITTIPIEGIINLREVTIPSRYNIQNFDGYYERVIAFDAPKGSGIQYGDGLVDEGTEAGQKCIPTDRDFSFNIRLTDDEEEYYETEHVKLEAVVDNKDSEYATFVYRISKLNSGSKYNLRVAAIDTSKLEDDGFTNPSSSYSEPITLRTEFNQDDYDRDTKYKEYEKYYYAVIGKINDDSYYVLENTTNSYTIKFKEDKFQGEIGATKSSTYSLPTTDTANSYTYYLSNANIKEMMRLKKGLQIEHDGIIVTIPYNFINDEYNEDYGTILKNCDSLKSDVEDFYLKLWIGFNTPQNYVSGNKTSSDQVQIAMKLIEQNSYNADIDGQLDGEVDDYIELNKDYFFVDVKAQLNNQIDDAKLIEFVSDEEEEIRDYIEKLASNYYSEYEMESYAITDLYKRIDFKFPTTDAASKIYTKSVGDTAWKQVSTTNSNGYANGYISKLGSTVLTTSTQANIIYADETTSNAYYEKSKYNLDNILVRNGSLNPATDKVSQDLFYDVAFAIIQTDTTNVFDLAKQKQALDDSLAFNNDPLTREEILYGVMQLYNQFSTVNINQVVINNANIAKQINFNSYYKQSILAGYQLGVLGYDDISNPKGYMTVNEMLELLYRVIG